MAEILLITKTDLQGFWSLGKNLDEGRIDPHILRAQQSDLKPFLGDALYFDFVSKVTDAKYVDLLNGKDYSYQGQTIFFGGVKPLLSAWSYSRIMKNNQIFVTRGGVNQKETEESTQHPNALVQQRNRDAQSEAIRLQVEVFNFLDQNPTIYPLFESSFVRADAPTWSTMRITKVGDQHQAHFGRHHSLDHI